MASSSFDAALGAFVGACVGDAAGAVLEFPRVDHISPERVSTHSSARVSRRWTLASDCQGHGITFAKIPLHMTGC